MACGIYIYMMYSFYPHPWISTSFPQVGPNPKWFVFSVERLDPFESPGNNKCGVAMDRMVLK